MDVLVGRFCLSDVDKAESDFFSSEDIAAHEAIRNCHRIEVFTEKFVTSGKPKWAWRNDRLNYHFSFLPDADLLLGVSKAQATNL